MNQRTRIQRRFDRQFRWLTTGFPWAAGPLAVIRHRALLILRLPLALIFIAGGFLAVLPVFGLWMWPVGLLLLAIDIPYLQGPISAAIVRGRRRLDIWRQARKK